MTHHICTTGLPSPTWDFLLSRNDSGWQGPHLVAHVWAVGGQSKCADQLEAKFTILFLRSSLMYWITNSLRLIFSKLVCRFEIDVYINMVEAFNYSKQNCVWLDNFPLGHIIRSVWDNFYDVTVLLNIEMYDNKKKHAVPIKSAKCAFRKDKTWPKNINPGHAAVYFCQEKPIQTETCLVADESGNNFNIKKQTIQLCSMISHVLVAIHCKQNFFYKHISTPKSAYLCHHKHLYMQHWMEFIEIYL